MDKKDYTCKDLAEVRSNIDRIDREIVTLIAERSKYVAEAAKFKSDQLAVRDAKRVEQVIEKVTELAIEYDVDTRLIETIYRTMIAAFVEQEMKDYSKE